MVINPFVFIFILYFIFNTLALLQALLYEGILVEIEFIHFELDVLLFSYFIQMIFLFLLLFFFLIFFSKKTTKNKIKLNFHWGLNLLILQITYLVFSIYYGVNIAGDASKVKGDSYIKYIFIILQVDILYIVLSVLLRSDKLFWINTIFYLFSMFYRGWMGGFLIAVLLFLSRFYPVRTSMKANILILLSFSVFIFLLPVLVDAKWAVRSGMSLLDFLSVVDQSFTFDKYTYSFGYIINRFQHLGHIALLFDNAADIRELYNQDVIKGYWMDGYPQYFLSQLFGSNGELLNSFMVPYFWGDDATWNTNAGLAGWSFILGLEVIFLILYLLFIVILPYYLLNKYAGNSLLLIVSCFSLSYLFHGWFGAYINLIIYALAFVFLVKARLANERGLND